jgi:hypothetical protein
MTFYLPEIMITFEVQFFWSEESRLERPFCFREFVPSPFCEGAASGRSTWACSEPNPFQSPTGDVVLIVIDVAPVWM